jgi:hypothetical protein
MKIDITIVYKISLGLWLFIRGFFCLGLTTAFSNFKVENSISLKFTPTLSL